MSKIEEIKSSINMIIYMHLHSEFEIDAEDN